ncbi:uncharacterized protein LDX57_004814 [Aspergillus melleus]|uniref:uncharacterized protein n=1 Tax=Aspergillus melleus TaxID=138277 RepID=UPI001E8ED8FC|nr:uncharacterized protein LDX57_004814 [Aspergillus melleus]KAH8427097.1 hypothetical protein LDX57_004814 [Aspergillus melleus]
MPDNFRYSSVDGVPDPSRRAAAPVHSYNRGSDVFDFNDASQFAPTLPNDGPYPRSPSHMMPSYGFAAWGNPSQPSGPESMQHAARFPSQANGGYVDADLDALAPPFNGSAQLLPMSFEQEPQAYTYLGSSASAQDGYSPANPARDAVHAGQVTQVHNRPILEQGALEDKCVCLWKDCPHQRPFNRKADVLRHVKEFHLSIKDKCVDPDCPKESPRRERMKEHIKKVHPSLAQILENYVALLE